MFLEGDERNRKYIKMFYLIRLFTSFKKFKKSSPLQRVVGSGSRTGVDVELVLVLEGLELVRVPGDEDVHVELPLQQRQAGHVPPRDHLVAVDQADLELPHRDHLLLRVVQVLRRRESCEATSWFVTKPRPLGVRLIGIHDQL